MTTAADSMASTDATVTEFTVTGMSCGHCERAISQEVNEVPGITGVDVSASTGLLRVTHTANSTQDAAGFADAVIAAVDEAGYTATPR